MSETLSDKINSYMGVSPSDPERGEYRACPIMTAGLLSNPNYDGGAVLCTGKCQLCVESYAPAPICQLERLQDMGDFQQSIALAVDRVIDSMRSQK